MLTINQIQSIDYYADLAAEDYYTAGGEPQGRWAGKAAVSLGLSGAVDTSVYRKLMAGYAPDGSALCDRPGDEHTPGWDATFSAPKSVSLVWARGDAALKQQIQRAHHQAVLAALAHLEKHAAMTRRGHNGAEQEHVQGLVVPTFEHCTSRAQDPQLHTHALISNVAPRADGSWGTLHGRALYKWQMAAGATYRAELAHQLQALGFAVEEDARSFHIAGVDKALCEHYSKRAKAIDEALDERGLSTSASKAGDIIKLDTRETKAAVDRPKLFQQWQAELTTLGFTEAHLAQLKAMEPAIPPILDQAAVVERLTERRSVFREQDIYQTAAELAQLSGDDARTAQHIAKAVLNDANTLSLGLDAKQNRIYTTQALLQREQQLVADAKALSQQQHFAIADQHIQQAIQSKGFPLSAEQQEAILTACQAGGFSILQGSAGAGKSASMDCVRAAYEAQGYQVIGAAIAKVAADNLAQEANLQESHTIAKLIDQIERGRSPLSERTVLIIDEAGQLGSQQLATLLEAAKGSNSKVVLVGEDKQLDAIEFGGCLRYLSRPEVLGTSRIQTIRRQRDDWARQAVADLRDGQAQAALDAHHARGLVHFAQDGDAARRQLVERWQQFRQQQPGKHALVLAQRWKDVQPLNAEIRRIHQAEGRVGQEDITVSCNVSDHVMEFAFSVGERVRFSKNDYRRGLSNGLLGTIERIEQREEELYFAIRTDDGRTVHLKQSDYCDEAGHLYLSQAYAMTVYASQGVTIDGDVFVLYNSGMDRAHSYVAGSRHKDQCHWFCNAKEIDMLVDDQRRDISEQERLEALAQQMSQDRYQSMAIEHWQEPEVPPPAREHQREAALALG